MEDPVIEESKVEFEDIDSDDSVEEAEGYASLSEKESDNYVGEGRNESS